MMLLLKMHFRMQNCYFSYTHPPRINPSNDLFGNSAKCVLGAQSPLHKFFSALDMYILMSAHGCIQISTHVLHSSEIHLLQLLGLRFQPRAPGDTIRHTNTLVSRWQWRLWQGFWSRAVSGTVALEQQHGKEQGLFSWLTNHSLKSLNITHNSKASARRKHSI